MEKVASLIKSGDIRNVGGPYLIRSPKQKSWYQVRVTRHSRLKAQAEGEASTNNVRAVATFNLNTEEEAQDIAKTLRAAIPRRGSLPRTKAPPNIEKSLAALKRQIPDIRNAPTLREMVRSACVVELLVWVIRGNREYFTCRDIAADESLKQRVCSDKRAVKMKVLELFELCYGRPLSSNYDFGQFLKSISEFKSEIAGGSVRMCRGVDKKSELAFYFLSAQPAAIKWAEALSPTRQL